MFLTLKDLTGAPAVIIGIMARAICAWQTTRRAETATHVNAFVVQAFASSPGADLPGAGPQTATRAPHCYPARPLSYCSI
jgi:hypothetical protein